MWANVDIRHSLTFPERMLYNNSINPGTNASGLICCYLLYDKYFNISGLNDELTVCFVFLIRRNRSCCCLFFSGTTRRNGEWWLNCQFPRNELRVALNDLPRNTLTHLDKLLCVCVSSGGTQAKEGHTWKKKTETGDANVVSVCEVNTNWSLGMFWFILYIPTSYRGGLGRKEIKKGRKKTQKREWNGK